MGFRSDVYICLKNEDYKELAKRTAELAKNENEEYMDTIGQADEITVLSDTVVITLAWRKWYDDYKEVALVNNFLDELRDADKPFKMVILNEDNTIEVNENYCKGECDHIEVYTGVNII